VGRRRAAGLPLLAAGALLASCGPTAHPTATAHPTIGTLLEHTSLTVAVDPAASSALGTALATVHHEAPGLRIAVRTVALNAVVETMLGAHPELLVTSLSPPAPLVAQSGLSEWPYAPEELTVAVNLGSTTGLVLSEAALSSLLTGRISVWDDATIAHLNPSLSLPPVPVTIAPIEPGSEVAIWLATALGLAPSGFDARTTAACATTVGCMAFLVNQVPSDAASILDDTQTARTPAEAAYPLRSAAAAFVEPQPTDPEAELAALLVVRALVEEGSVPAPQRTVELDRLAARIDHLAGEIP
jgi:hypothetical protein